MVYETALYEQLGVSYNASLDEIKRSYRKAAKLWHPDRNPDNPEAAENFKACLQAYEILSDADKRAVYDRHGLGAVLPSGSPTREQQQQQRQTQRYQQPAPPASSNTYSYSSSSSGQGPRGFTFSTSWSFQVGGGSGTGHGSYSTHYQSWNSRDGHRSSSRSGTFGGGGHEQTGRAPNSNSVGGNNMQNFGGIGSGILNDFHNWTNSFFFPFGGGGGGGGTNSVGGSGSGNRINDNMNMNMNNGQTNSPRGSQRRQRQQQQEQFWT